MVKKQKIRKRRKKRTRKSKVIKRIGVFVPIQADITFRKKELDKYIVKQGCQRLTPIWSVIDTNKGITEIYARVRYVGKVKAKKLKPITPDVIEEELQRMTTNLKHAVRMGEGLL